MIKMLFFLFSIILMVSTVSAVEIYNKSGNRLYLFSKVDALHYFTNDNSGNGDRTYVLIGLKGEKQISNFVTGYGKWEYQIQGNVIGSESCSLVRLAFVGLKFGDIGFFDYGRNNGIIHNITSWTDVLPGFGSGIYNFDNFIQQCGNNFVTYRSNDFFGLVDRLKFTMQYQGKNGKINEEDKKNNILESLKQNGDSIAGSLSYELGKGFTIGGATSRAKRISTQSKANFGTGDHAKILAGGLKYDANDIYIAVQCTKTQNATRVGKLGWANKALNFEMVAQYQFDFGLCPSIVYSKSQGKNLNHVYGNKDLLKCINIAATHHFNKSMSAYVNYKINLLHDDDFTQQVGINTTNIVAFGLNYQF